MSTVFLNLKIYGMILSETEVTVMKIKYNCIVCYVLMAVMFFMAVYQGNDETYAMNDFSAVSHSCSFAGSFDEAAEPDESCTIEMLGISNIFSCVRPVRYSNLKGFMKNTLTLLCSGLFMDSISNLYIAVITVRLPEPYYKTAVLDYIQGIDGKK